MTRSGAPTIRLLAAYVVLIAPTPGRAQPRDPLALAPEQRAAEAIEKALRQHAPDVHRCFERALADRIDVAGDLEVEVDVGKAGRVVAAKLGGATAASAPPALAACVEGAAKGFVLTGIEEGASVVLPFSFQGQVDQFAIKASDAPVRGPKAPAGKAAPFAVKVLVDPVNTRVPKAALTTLTIAPKNRVAMHRHPGSAKALYLLSGRARLLGPTGAAAIAIDPGSAVFVPPGYPHALETTGAKEPAVFLQVFAPPGPEQVYRDPTSPAARAHFEVVRDPRAAAPAGAAPVLVPAGAPASSEGKPPDGQPAVRVLLDQKATGVPDLSLSVIDFPAGYTLPRHAHDGATELLYVARGAGTLEVGSEQIPYSEETALYLPAGQPHAVKLSAAGPSRVIQIFAPAGPEQRGMR